MEAKLETTAVARGAPLARTLSILLHPLAVGSPVALWVGISEFGGLTRQAVELIVWVGTLGAALPLAVLYALKRAGRISNLFLTDAVDRRWLYPIGLVDLALVFAIFRLYEASPIILATVAAAGATGMLMGVVNRFSKLSVHCAGNAGIVLALCWVRGFRLWPLWALVVLTVWARLASREHTLPEVAAGLIAGTLPVVAVLLAWLGTPTW